jgi:membrane protein involved in colicin uptake
MKKIIPLVFAILPFAAFAEDVADVESYDAEGSVFQKIADLEQEKVLMQLEKEKAQLQLDLDRLSAEQTRLARDQESADARAEEQAAEIEKQKLAIEQERQKLDEQKKKLAEEAAKRAASDDSDDEPAPAKRQAKASASANEQDAGDTLGDKYALVEIVGAGNQLVATVENIGNGKQKKISVGKNLDGYAVRSISIDDGVEFEKDGEVLTIGIGSFGKGASDE